MLLVSFIRSLLLRRLTLRNTPDVTDDGIAALVTLRKLAHLTLIELQITGEALPRMANFPSLVSLDLRMCNNLRRDALANLAEAPKLRELKLGDLQNSRL